MYHVHKIILHICAYITIIIYAGMYIKHSPASRLQAKYYTNYKPTKVRL